MQFLILCLFVSFAELQPSSKTDISFFVRKASKDRRYRIDFAALSGQVDFLNFARNSMKNRDPESRPALSDIKHHPYFQQVIVYLLYIFFY